MNTLTQMPAAFSRGSTVEYTRTVTDYPATAGWTLSVHIAGRSKLSKNASASGSDYAVLLTAADTAVLEAGTYTWLERVTDGTAVHDVGSGTVTITPNVATAAAGDLRSFDEKALEAIEAALLVDMGSTTVSYQVAGRGEVTMDRREAMKLRDTLARRVNRSRNGGRLGQTMQVSFRRP